MAEEMIESQSCLGIPMIDATGRKKQTKNLNVFSCTKQRSGEGRVPSAGVSNLQSSSVLVSFFFFFPSCLGKLGLSSGWSCPHNLHLVFKKS